MGALNGVKYRDWLGIEHQEDCGWAESWWGIEERLRAWHLSITHISFPFTLVSTGSLAQQYAHPNATLHPHTPHPQPSATPTGQQPSQHGGSHPAPSPVQVRRNWEAFTRTASSFCLLSVFFSARQDARYHVIKTPSSPASWSQCTALQAVPPGLNHLKVHIENKVMG